MYQTAKSVWFVVAYWYVKQMNHSRPAMYYTVVANMILAPHFQQEKTATNCGGHFTATANSVAQLAGLSCSGLCSLYSALLPSLLENSLSSLY